MVDFMRKTGEQVLIGGGEVTITVKNVQRMACTLHVVGGPRADCQFRMQKGDICVVDGDITVKLSRILGSDIKGWTAVLACYESGNKSPGMRKTLARAEAVAAQIKREMEAARTRAWDRARRQEHQERCEQEEREQENGLKLLVPEDQPATEPTTEPTSYGERNGDGNTPEEAGQAQGEQEPRATEES